MYIYVSMCNWVLINDNLSDAVPPAFCSRPPDTTHTNHHPQTTARYTQQTHSGYDTKHPVVRWLWETVHEMDLESQRKLLMFVTGSFKAPIGGLGKLSLLIQCAGPDSDSLPTSHTCFNTLLLPRYASKEKLQRLLRIAINECQGFGLQ